MKTWPATPLVHQRAGSSPTCAWPTPGRIHNADPHQLSGGGQQRSVIPITLIRQPARHIPDQPTTASAVTVKAGIDDLVKDPGVTYGTPLLFISHHLGLILDTCDRIYVLYSSAAVTSGNAVHLFDKMRHPYARALLRSIPGAYRTPRPLVTIPQSFPLPDERPPGCTFGPRSDRFRAGRCAACEFAMRPVCVDDHHASRCAKSAQIDRNAPMIVTAGKEKLPSGTAVPKTSDLRKDCPVFSGAFGGSIKVPKANETLSFAAHTGETLASAGVSGGGNATFAKVLVTASLRHHQAV